MIPSPPLNAVHLGPVTIHLYGFIIALAITICYILALKIAKEKGFSSDDVDSYFFTTIPVALIFARGYHVFTNWSIYAKNPLSIFAVWNGGLGILGAIIGGALTLFYLSKKTKHNFIAIADFIFPLLALGQAIGRWGNYFNQELYGSPSTLPWAVHIDEINRLPAVKQYPTFHPTFLYESLLNFINFGILWVIYRKYSPRGGIVTSLYLLNYGIIRFLVELVKLDPDTDSKIGLLRVPQYLALLLVSIGVVLAIRSFHQKKIEHRV